MLLIIGLMIIFFNSVKSYIYCSIFLFYCLFSIYSSFKLYNVIENNSCNEMIEYEFNEQILACLSLIVIVFYNILNNHYYNYDFFHIYRLIINFILFGSSILHILSCYVSNSLSFFYYMEFLLIEKGKSMTINKSD